MLLGDVRRAVRRYRMLDPGDLVVVAVSGGSDSVALLYALRILGREQGLKLHAAHLNHGIRGQEADADEALVRDLAERAGVHLSVERLEGESLLRGAGLEARARRARYEFLHRVATRLGAGKIATGHTRDDQAETVLLRLLRGSGSRGLAGILPLRSDGVVRPLIFASREKVLAFLQTAGLAFREDRTNADLRFLRNRVRHEVLPLLRAIAPRVDERLARLADALRADAGFLDAETDRVLGERGGWQRRVRGEGRELLMDRAFLRMLPEALRRRTILRVLAEMGAPSDRAAAAVAAIEEHLAGDFRDGVRPGGIDLRGGGRIAWESSGLRAGSSRIEASPFDLPLLLPGETRIPDGSALCLEIVAGSSDAVVFGPKRRNLCTAVFDADAIRGPLRVRSWRAGDRFRPRGFGHRRKVQDLLTEGRIPREVRNGVPLVVMEDEILWVAGIRESEVGAPTQGTARLLILRHVGAESSGTMDDECP